MIADSVKDTGGVYFVPAFSGLFAPYWRSDARGRYSKLEKDVKINILRFDYGYDSIYNKSAYCSSSSRRYLLSNS